MKRRTPDKVMYSIRMDPALKRLLEQVKEGLMSSKHITAGESNASREILFKTDRPKPIDRFIDYFGGETKSEAEDRVSEPLSDIGEYLAG